MISPTIGRVVLYHPKAGATTTHAAIVAYVWSDRMVNLAVFDENGHAYSVTSVTLVQPEDETAPTSYCEWMPYQKGQAAKTEALEAAMKSPGPQPLSGGEPGEE
jgi:hypothetical protein